MRKFGIWLLKDKKNAAAIALLFSLLPLVGLPTSWIASVIIGLVTLQKGNKEGLFTVFWASLPAAILWYLGASLVFISLLIAQFLFVQFLAGIWRQYGSMTLMLEVVAGIGIIGLFFVSFYADGIREFWVNIVTKFSNLQFGPELNAYWNQLLIKISTGMMMSLLLLSNIVNVMIARWWQAAVYKPGAFVQEFITVRAGKAISVLFLFCWIAIALDVNFAYGLVFVIAIPLVFAGLSLMHSMAMQHKNKIVLLIILYGMFIIFSIYFIPLLAVVGFFDSWYDVRGRHIRNRNT